MTPKPTPINKDDWPYPYVDELYNHNPALWHETSENIYWEQLECVPPARMKSGAFMVGEPWSHDERGAIHSAFMIVAGRYFMKMDHKIDFNPGIYYRQIKKQFKIFTLEIESDGDEHAKTWYLIAPGYLTDLDYPYTWEGSPRCRTRRDIARLREVIYDNFDINWPTFREQCQLATQNNIHTF